MPAHRSSSSTSMAARPPSRGPYLRFISPEAPTAIPAYPSFKDRLSGTDTWTKALSAPAGPPSLPPGSLARAGSSSSSRTASSSLTPSLSPAPCAHSSRSPSTPRGHPYARARSSSSSASASSGASTARSTDSRLQVQAAQAAAVRDAVRRGRLDANSYTDGQLYAIREGAAQAFARGGGGGGSGTRSREGRRGEGEVQAREKRKRRGAGIEGREGGVVKAVKVRRSSCAVEGEGSEDDEGEERVEVEVDLRRMLGL